MKDIVHWWQRIWRSIPLVLVWMAAVSVLCMAILICYDVAMRYFFNAPTSWAIEVAQYLMLATIFLPLAYVQQTRNHIKVELLTSNLPARVRNILSNIIIPVFILMVNSVILWQVGKLSWKHMTRGTVSATVLRLPLFPFSMILVVAFLIAIFVTLAQFKKRRPGTPIGSSGNTSSQDMKNEKSHGGTAS